MKRARLEEFRQAPYTHLCYLPNKHDLGVIVGVEGRYYPNTCRLTIVDLPETRFLGQYLRQFLKSPTGYKPGRQSPTEGDPPAALARLHKRSPPPWAEILTGCLRSLCSYSPTLLE